jgi:hypothetical protein
MLNILLNTFYLQKFNCLEASEIKILNKPEKIKRIEIISMLKTKFVTIVKAYVIICIFQKICN